MRDEIEKLIVDKGLTAPRVTPEDIEGQVVKEVYYVFPGTQTTICLLVLVNGFTVTGESACASPENYDEVVGNRIARENAVNKIWQLEGYLLKEKIYRGTLTVPA